MSRTLTKPYQGKGDALTAEELRSLRKRKFAAFILELREVSDTLPKGKYSRNDLHKLTGLSIPSIRSYEHGKIDPVLIQESAMRALAEMKGWTVKEYLAYFRGQDMTEQICLDEVLASVRWKLTPTDLIQVLGTVTTKLQEYDLETVRIAEEPKVEEPILTTQKLIEAVIQTAEDKNMSGDIFLNFLQCYGIDEGIWKEVLAGGPLAIRWYEGFRRLLSMEDKEDEWIELIQDIPTIDI